MSQDAGRANHPKRYFISYAHQDRDAIEPIVSNWQALGLEIFLDEQRLSGGDVLADTLREEIERSDEVHVFWSESASESEWVARELEWALAEWEAVRLQRLVPHRLDATPLPETLERFVAVDHLPKGRVDLWTGLGLLSLIPLFSMVESFLQLCAWVLLLMMGLLLTYWQYTGSLRRLTWAVAFRRGASWLRGATVIDVIGLTDRILNRIYGVDLYSRRAARVTAVISLAVIGPLALQLAVIVGIERGSPLVGVVSSLFFSVPLALINIFADFYSVLFTRSMIRWVVRWPKTWFLWTALLMDLVWILFCMALPIKINTFRIMFGDLEVGFIPLYGPVLHHLQLMVSGDLNPWRLLLGGGAPFFFLMLALAAFTAALPSLIHLLLLGATLVDRLSRGRLLGEAGLLMSRLGSDPHGPLARLYTVAVCFAALVLVWPATSNPPAENPRFGEVVEAGEYWIGSPEDEVGRLRDETLRQVEIVRPYRLMSTEVTREWWMTVWDRGQRWAEAWGLPREPSTYRLNNAPVETVSWCQAARFANLWSWVEERELAYCVGPTCFDSTPTDPATGGSLVGCEQGEDVQVDLSSSGYRLPSEVEWEVAARAGTDTAYWSGSKGADLARVGWYVVNSPLRPRPVAQKRANPLGLYDMHGNVWEWTTDLYQGSQNLPFNELAEEVMASSPNRIEEQVEPSEGEESGASEAPALIAPLEAPLPPAKVGPQGVLRVMRGGSNQTEALSVRSAARKGNSPRMSRADIGFRLLLLE